jgi:hypothetical protein
MPLRGKTGPTHGHDVHRFQVQKRTSMDVLSLMYGTGGRTRTATACANGF